MSKFYRTADRTVLLELFGPGESVENLKSLKANTTDAAVEVIQKWIDEKNEEIEA